MNHLNQLATLFERTQDELQKHAVRAVDSSLVVRNWLFGWYLVEFENADAGRAELYGKKLIETLANQLKQRGLKGCSAPNLNRFRRFYLEHQEIRSTLLIESSPLSHEPSDLLDCNHFQIPQALSVELFRHFTLAWACRHFVCFAGQNRRSRFVLRFGRPSRDQRPAMACHDFARGARRKDFHHGQSAAARARHPVRKGTSRDGSHRRKSADGFHRQSLRAPQQLGLPQMASQSKPVP